MDKKMAKGVSNEVHRSRVRALCERVLLLLISFILSILAMEFGTRWFLGEQIVLFPRNHAVAQYGDFVIRRMIPNIEFWHKSIDGRWRFKINNRGFRDDTDYSYKKPNNTFRIITLGDSNTVGFEVRQNKTYSEQLELTLNGRGLQTQVINTGVSGFGTAEQIIFLENEGIKYDPDVVVIGFFENDYEDNIKTGFFELINGKLKLRKNKHAPATSIIRITHVIPGLKWLGEN